MAEVLVMVPSGSVARKELAPSDPNRMEVGGGLTLCVLSGSLPAPSTHSGRDEISQEWTLPQGCPLARAR